MIKGARRYELERISALLEAQVHQTRVEVNLTALVNNYKKIKTKVGPDVKIMAMVKAFGYGSGSVEVASALQFHHVDYLAVAYADEGVDLRKAGIKVPIMVMNADPAAYDTLIKYHLEPELFSFEIVASFSSYLLSQGIQSFPVHIKLNTGMNRLGFDIDEVPRLTVLLKTHASLKVQTIFSHLSASGKEKYADFTKPIITYFLVAGKTAVCFITRGE
jgi:alanine racemase